MKAHLEFNSENKSIIISSDTACEWSCVVSGGNFSLTNYYGTFKNSSGGTKELNIITYGASEIEGQVIGYFKSNKCVQKEELFVPVTPAHYFVVFNEDVQLFGENTKTYINIKYGTTDKTYEDVAKPLTFNFLSNNKQISETYEGVYKEFEVKENENTVLYKVSIQPYSSTQFFKICIESKCSYEFNDSFDIVGYTDNGRKKTFTINIKQNKTNEAPSLFDVNPKILYFDSNNSVQKINVVSLVNGVSSNYSVSSSSPNNEISNDNDIEAYINGKQLTTPIDSYSLSNKLNFEIKPNYFIVDASKCEEDNENINDGEITSFILYVNTKDSNDKTITNSVECFYQYIYDENNVIEIVGANNIYAYVDEDGNYEDLTNSNKIDLNEGKTSISIYFTKEKKQTTEFKNCFLSLYSEKQNVGLTIKSIPSTWQIIQQSENVNVVKNANNLLLSLKDNIDYNEDDEIVLINDFGKKCYINVFCEENLIQNDNIKFCFTKSNENECNSSIEVSSADTITLYSVSEKDVIINKDTQFNISSEKTTITLNTLFYEYDSYGKLTKTSIESYNFDILYNSNIGKKYIKYGPVRRFKIEKNEATELKDYNIYYFENDVITIPIPFMTKNLPWYVVNNGSTLKYNVKGKDYNLNSLYYPSSDSTTFKITNVVPNEMEENVIYLQPQTIYNIENNISTIILRQEYTQKEVFLYVNRGSETDVKVEINKYGTVPSIQNMKDMLYDNIADLLSNRNDIVKINVNTNEIGEGYYASYTKENYMTANDNNNVKFYIVRKGESIFNTISLSDNISKSEHVSLLKYTASDNELNNMTIPTDEFFEQAFQNAIPIENEWEINDGFVYISGETDEKIFPQTGITTFDVSENDSQKALLFSDNYNKNDFYILLFQPQKYVNIDGEKIEVQSGSTGEYFNTKCLYEVINKSVEIDNNTYILDKTNSFIYNGNKCTCYKTDEGLFVDLVSKSCNVQKDDEGFYITVQNNRIPLNENLECEYKDILYSPEINLNLNSGFTIEVLENVDGDKKEKYVILNDKKYIANIIQNENTPRYRIQLDKLKEYEFSGNTITFDDYKLNVINEPGYEYVVINYETYKLIDGFIIFNGEKYNKQTKNINNENVELIIINNYGYQVKKQQPMQYVIINDKKYFITSNVLSANTITNIKSIYQVSENYYWNVDEIENKIFKYELNFNELFENDLITAMISGSVITNGYVDYENKKYPVEKSYYFETNNDIYDVIENDVVNIELSKDITECTILFHDDTELIEHIYNKNESQIFTSGNTKTFQLDKEPILFTINDYSQITFKTYCAIQVQNDCEIVYGNSTISLVKNETLIINSNSTITFTNVTKIKLFSSKTIPLHVFKQVALIDGKIYVATILNDKQIIQYNNNTYYILDGYIHLPNEDEPIKVYEKYLPYRILTKRRKPNKEYVDIIEYYGFEVNNVSDNLNEYCYIQNNEIKKLEKPQDSVSYTIHLPKYDEEKKWLVGSYELKDITIFKLDNITYTRAEVLYDNNHIFEIENGKMKYNITVYDVEKITNNISNDTSTPTESNGNTSSEETTSNNIQTFVIIDNSTHEFNLVGNSYYGFWDYYDKVYNKKIKQKLYFRQDTNIDINSNITLHNVTYKVDENKYVKINGKYYEIFNDDSGQYVNYENTNYLVKNGIAYVDVNVPLIGKDNTLEKYALYDANSYLSHNMYFFESYKKQGNIRTFEVENAIGLSHDEQLIIEIKTNDGKLLYGGYLINFK